MIDANTIQACCRVPTSISDLENCISALESAKSSLESHITALENSSLPWEYFAWLFTFFVIVGVGLELWVIWHDWREESETWAEAFFGINRTLRPSLPKLRIEIASVLLVTIGVAGELGTGIGIEVINLHIRHASIDLQSMDDELRNKSDQLVALVQSETASLRLENTRLLGVIQPREISYEQRLRIKAELRPFLRDGVEIYVYTFNDEEAYEFGLQIRDTLKFSGLDSSITTNGPLTTSGTWYNPPVPGKTGIEIEGPKTGKERLMKRLTYALGTVGGFKISPPEQIPSAVTIVVLAKPLPTDAEIKDVGKQQ